MSAFQFQAKLMAALLLVTVLLVALEAPTLVLSYGPEKTLAIAFDMRSEGSRSRKFNAGREGGFVLASLDSDNKGEELEGFSFRTRSLRSRRLPPPPPAPMGNRHKVTAIHCCSSQSSSLISLLLLFVFTFGLSIHIYRFIISHDLYDVVFSK